MWSLWAALAGPAAVVAIDLNPSLNLALDRSGRVLTAEPLNAHASHLLRSVSVAGLDLADALTRLLDQAWHLGYLSPSQRNVVFIAFVRLRMIGNDLSLAPDAAYQAVERSLMRHRAGGTVFVYEARARLYREASAAGVTVSRYLLIRKALHGDQGSKARTLDLSELLAQVGVSNLFDSNMVLGPVIQRLVPVNQDSSSYPYVDPFAHGGGDPHEPAPVNQSRVVPVERGISAKEQKQQTAEKGSTASGSNQLQGQTPSPAAYESAVPPGTASTVTQTAGQLVQGVFTEVPETSREATVTARTAQQMTPVTEAVTGAVHWGDDEATSGLITRQTAGVVGIPSVPHEPTVDARDMTGHSGEPALPDTSPDVGNTTRAGEPTILLPPPTQGSGEAKPAVPQPEPVTPPVGSLQPAYAVLPIP
ncbi:MAG: anti-sigma-I factor RsgI family protein [Bacillota bacterium]